MCGLRHALGKRAEHGGSAVGGILFERRAAREHQHDNSSHQVLAHSYRGNNGCASQQVRSELPADETLGQVDYEGYSSRNKSH